MSYTAELAKRILNVLQRMDHPITIDELSFRIRSTPSVVMEETDKLVEADLVKKEGSGYSIDASARTSRFKASFSY